MAPPKLSTALRELHPDADRIFKDVYAIEFGKLAFYVEALDRNDKKPHERPSIGVLLCANKDDEVVEFTLARTVSPTLVAEYRTVLPPKEILRAKLHELYALAASETGQDDGRRHAEGQHENIVGSMSSTRFGTDTDPPALGLTQPPSQVADMPRWPGPPPQPRRRRPGRYSNSRSWGFPPPNSSSV